MKSISLSEMFRFSAEQMNRDLKKRLIEHGGELGRDREKVIREVLRDRIIDPKIIISAKGRNVICTGAGSDEPERRGVEPAARSRRLFRQEGR
jgi:hypothetical protein